VTDGDGFLASLSVTPLPEGFSADDFDCGEPDLTDYLCDGTAASDEAAGVSRTYLVWSRGKLVAYFAVLADSIRLRTKERPRGMRYPTAPAVKLGRMGVGNEYKGRDVGVWILDLVVGIARELANQVGVRYVTLDALQRPTLIDWYEEYGFVRNVGAADLSKLWLKSLGRFKEGDELQHVSMRFDIKLQEETTAEPPSLF
jgi:predicted GNAT family N-acyltransferase